MKLYILLLVLLVYVSSFASTTKRCHPIDQCSCKLQDTGEVVSLHALDGGKQPRYVYMYDYYIVYVLLPKQRKHGVNNLLVVCSFLLK